MSKAATISTCLPSICRFSWPRRFSLRVNARTVFPSTRIVQSRRFTFHEVRHISNETHKLPNTINMTSKSSARPWYRTGTVYQVWPTSYKDSNKIGTPGIGDIRGVIETLPHLLNLGIDIIWMSPMYESPQKDFGYDISDFTKVWSTYGTNDDMFELIAKCHEAGVKVILDLVMNHTSDEHAWFQESKKSKDNEKADWYIWKDGKVDEKTGKMTPPNNWRSIFEGSIWEWCEERGQYYLHLFAPAQPDLNWENKDVRKAVYKDAIEFWMDHGVDGFRVDAVNLLSKDQTFQDAEVTEPDMFDQRCEKHFQNGPRMHEWLKEMHREAIDKHGDVMLVGELANSDAAKTLEYVSPDSNELSMVFDGGVVDIQRLERPMWEVEKPPLVDVKKGFKKQQEFLEEAWTTVFMENHDQPRSINRFLTDDIKYHNQVGRLLAILSGSLSGTLFIYQGQEIGMMNMPDWWDESHLRDPADLNKLREIEKKHPDDKSWYENVLGGIRRLGRDNARTPVQWTSGKNAGFSESKPWIDIPGNEDIVNIKDQEGDPNSVFHTWKKMLQLRKQYQDALVFGTFHVDDMADQNVFTYIKDYQGEQTVLVILNWTKTQQGFKVPQRLQKLKLRLLVGNVDEQEMQDGTLEPFEARLYLVER